MNLVLLFHDDFIGGMSHVRLTGRRYEHICRIHRASMGDELTVGLCGGLVGKGKITALNGDMIEMDVSFHHRPPDPLPVTLALALPRPLMLNRVLIGVTSMGVKRVILFHSKRVEKSFWNSPVLREDHLRAQTVLGLEQARDTVLPEIRLCPQWTSFFENELGRWSKGTLGLVAHPEAVDPCPRQVDQPITLVIGPEGGLVPDELDQFRSIGFRLVSMGERILRVETAVSAILSKLF